MRLIALDPGPKETGYVMIRDTTIIKSGVEDNLRIYDLMNGAGWIDATCAIEMISSYGMAVGAEVFETCVWVGRFQEHFKSFDTLPTLVYRRDVKIHLCGTSRAKDTNVRQAILDLYPRIGEGATPQIGTKKHPGPLYGVKSHAMAALAVALTYAHSVGENIVPKLEVL